MAKRPLLILLTCLLILTAAFAEEEQKIPPEKPVPDYITWLLEIASGEVGYQEGPHGYTKYGEWSGDPYAQWCAEYLCWCVDQVDQQHGTRLLYNVYPLYSSSNTGRSWFIDHGRYIVRTGYLENWGPQWLTGKTERLRSGDYIPQPGDWVFFTWDSNTDTDHVAMVEYCTRAWDGQVTIHVLEGNAPNKVQRTEYDLNYNRILGYGTVHDMADVTMRQGCNGEKVAQLQEKLRRLGFLSGQRADGHYGSGTIRAIRLFQQQNSLPVNGIADQETQLKLDKLYQAALDADPETWRILDDEE